MIVTRRLTKRFGRLLAVDGLDLDIPRGCVVGFLGPNGSGKTTTIRMLCGVLAPSAGTIRIDGLDSRDQPRAVRSRIGYLPETAPLPPEMRVDEFLTWRSRLFSLPRRDRGPAVDRALQRCGLGDVRRRRIGPLSRGYRQRVGLAAALLHDPAVLVLDEPTAGLDPAQVAEFRLLVRDLAGTRTVLLSTHHLREVESTCDRAILITGGRVRRDDTLENLRGEFGSLERLFLELANGDGEPSS